MEFPPATVTLEQLRALNNPLRLEIHSRLEGEGPASARELAERMEVDELRLYYHLKILARLRLIKPVSTRPTATKPEVVYAVADQIWAFGFDLQDPAVIEAFARHCEALLKLAAQEYRSAMERYRGDPDHICSYYRYLLRMSTETRKEFDRRLYKLVQWALSEEQDDQPRFNVTVSISPPVSRKSGPS